MAHQGFGGVLDTPRSNAGDATYLSRLPDFADISQEASFQSPDKDDDLLQQLRNGGRSNGISIRTPRQRGPLADRRNLPSNIGGGEFTPLLKSATRNSTRRNGKENNAATTTPAALRRIDEDDVTPLPRMDFSVYSTRNASYLDNDLPQLEASSVTSTPMGFPPRRDGDKGPLQDGNQLSLREQEHVIDKIEKENFGLKLKIHFLEEALRKAGPGFSEAALKENTELKVDKVTMQRELQRYKKQITTAERDLESFRQQMLELQEKAKKKYSNDDNQQAELDTLRQTLQDRESNIDELQRQVSQGQNHEDKVEKLQDNIEDLEAELREKDRLITEREDELDTLRQTLQDHESNIDELQQQASQGQGQEDKVEKLQENIEDLEAELREKERTVAEREDELDTLRQALQDHQSDISKLQRQVSQGQDRGEKAEKLQENLEDLEAELREKEQAIAEQEDELDTLRQALQDRESSINKLQRQVSQGQDHGEKAEKLQENVEDLEAELDALRQTLRDRESDINRLQRQVSHSQQHEGQAGKLQDTIEDLEAELDTLRQALQDRESNINKLQRQVSQGQGKVETLQDNIKDLEAELDTLRQTLHDREFNINKIQRQVSQGQDHENKVKKLQDNIENLEAELDTLRQTLQERESDIDELQHQISQGQHHEGQVEKLIEDLEVELGERERMIKEQEDKISGLRAEIRERDSLYDNDSEKWETEKKMIESKRAQAEEKATGLQRTVDRLREAEGSLSHKEDKLQEAIQSEADRHRSEEGVLSRQIDDLQEALETRQGLLSKLRNELSTVRDELRQTQVDYQAQVNRVVVLEVEVDKLELRGDAEHKASQAIKELQQQLDDIEDQKLVLEEILEEAREDAEQTAAQHEHALQRLVQRLNKAERERDAAAASHTETNKQSQRLRKSQAEIENLEQDVLQQQELIDALVASEAVLRRKLERARSERAAYRMSAEKLQKDLQLLKKEAQGAQKQGRHHGSADAALDTIVRAAEGAEARHKKELRGMVVQMEWMQARWEREASLRSDGAYAKKFLQLQLNVAKACNKAQLRELEHVRTHVLQSQKPLALPKSRSSSSSSPTLKSFLIMARFIARTRIAARNWAAQEAVRQKLCLVAEEKRRNKRSKQLKVVPVGVF